MHATRVLSLWSIKELEDAEANIEVMRGSHSGEFTAQTESCPCGGAKGRLWSKYLVHHSLQGREIADSLLGQSGRAWRLVGHVANKHL